MNCSLSSTSPADCISTRQLKRQRSARTDSFDLLQLKISNKSLQVSVRMVVVYSAVEEDSGNWWELRI